MSRKILRHPEIGQLPLRSPTHKSCGAPFSATCRNSGEKNLNIELDQRAESRQAAMPAKSNGCLFPRYP
jgi:hypothetical protein